MQTVRQWLEQLGLQQYAEVFAQNDVDLEALRLLSESDLEKLGISLGNRRKLLSAIARFEGDAQAIRAADIPLDPESPDTEAQRRQLTVLFCDLVGSTELATKLDPEQLRDLMQAYQRTCREVIERYEGHVAQYLGDGLMVYFGWPRAHEDDAVRAIRAGLEVTQAVSKLTAARPLSARVGIHTGLVVVGETGQGDASIPKAAVGETPNITARLQALAEAGSVVVSQRTLVLAGRLFDYTDLGVPALKGVTEPLRVFRVSGTRPIESRFEATRTDVSLTPLVGREEEIALLLRRWQQAKEGEGQVVLLGGEPGIGKSRLTRVLRERLGSEHCMVLQHQCSPYHLNSALYPIIEHIERAAGFAREDSAEQKLDKMQAVLEGSPAQIAHAAPLFAALLSLPLERYPPLKLSPQKQREETLDALAVQVETLALRRPLLIVWEDVHWIDATSQESLDMLVPRVRNLPVLLIVTYRPEYSARWTDQAHVTPLGLNRLGRRQGMQLIAKLTGGKALPQEVLDQILGHTDGVPLFIEELTKSVLESKLLREEGSRYALEGPLPALGIPTTLRDSLIARLDRLAPMREVAQIGACIGREFSYELLTAASPLRGIKLDEALEQLTKTGLVFRRGTPPDATYTFKHALVQDAAYDSLLKSKRVQLHAQIADALEKHFTNMPVNEPETLAHHFTQAGLATKAITYWHAAGQRATERFAYPDAVTHFRRGIELAGTLPNTRDVASLELNLQIGLGWALFPSKGWTAPEALRAFTRAQVLCQQVGDNAAPFGALEGLGIFSLVRGEVHAGREFFERGVVLAERASPEKLLLAHAHRGWSEYFLGHFTSARSDLEKSIALYDPAVHGHDATTGALHWLVLTLWALGYPDQALSRCTELEALAREVALPFVRCLAAHASAMVHQLRREAAASENYADAMIALADDQGFPHYAALGGAFRSLSLIQQGKGGTRELATIQKAIDSLRAMGSLEPALRVQTFLAQAHLELNDLHAALEVGREGLRVTREYWQGELETLFLKLLADVLLAGEGSEAEAENFYREAIAVARCQEGKSRELQAAVGLARQWSSQGKQREARELLAPIYRWFTEGLDTKDLKDAKALLDGLS